MRGKKSRLVFSLPFLWVTLLLPLLTGESWLPLFFLAAALHEAGHLAALRCLGGRVERFCFRLSGAEICYSGHSLSYGQEVALALAGPASNALWACLCATAVGRWPSGWLYRFTGCHVVLAAFNLLPALPLDGGRVLFLVIDFLVLAFTRRRLDPKYEGYVNTGGFVLLMALMVFVMYNDVMRLIR